MMFPRWRIYGSEIAVVTRGVLDVVLSLNHRSTLFFDVLLSVRCGALLILKGIQPLKRSSLPFASLIQLLLFHLHSLKRVFSLVKLPALGGGFGELVTTLFLTVLAGLLGILSQRP